MKFGSIFKKEIWHGPVRNVLFQYFLGTLILSKIYRPILIVIFSELCLASCLISQFKSAMLIGGNGQMTSEWLRPLWNWPNKYNLWRTDSVKQRNHCIYSLETSYVLKKFLYSEIRTRDYQTNNFKKYFSSKNCCP